MENLLDVTGSAADVGTAISGLSDSNLASLLNAIIAANYSTAVTLRATAFTERRIEPNGDDTTQYYLKVTQLTLV